MAQELARRRELHQSLLKSDTKQTRDDKKGELRQLRQVQKKTRVVHAMCSFFLSVSRSPYRVSMEFTFKWWTSRNKMFVMTN